MIRCAICKKLTNYHGLFLAGRRRRRYYFFGSGIKNLRGSARRKMQRMPKATNPMIRAVSEPGERTSPITAPTMERARTTITAFVHSLVIKRSRTQLVNRFPRIIAAQRCNLAERLLPAAPQELDRKSCAYFVLDHTRSQRSHRSLTVAASCSGVSIGLSSCGSFTSKKRPDGVGI